MKKIIFLVPTEDCEDVKNAMFDAGAGSFGNYDKVSWQTLGTGQFRPLAGSTPSIGEINRLKTVTEFRVEMYCSEDCLAAVINALNKSHPYENPVFELSTVEASGLDF